MACVDVVIPSYRGIATEAYGPLIAMIQATNCMCRGPHGEKLHDPWKCPNGKHSVRFMPPIYSSSVVHWARNQSVAQALYGQPNDGRPEAEYLFLMDDDMVPEQDYLLRLLRYKLDIVCGICTIRRDPPRPNIRFWNENESRFYDPLEWDWDSQKLMEIDGAGAAFMLVKRKVFERMAEAFLNCQFELEEDTRKVGENETIQAYWSIVAASRRARFVKAMTARSPNDPNARVEKDWKSADCWWFQFLDRAVDAQVGEMGEDLSFCWKAKRLGFKLYADPQVTPGHLGVYAYSIADYRAYIEQAKTNGAYPTIPLPDNKAALEAVAV